MIQYHNRMMSRMPRRMVVVAFALAALLVLAGCTAPAMGWAGGAISNGTLYIVSADGSLVAIDSASGRKLWGQMLEGLGSRPGGLVACSAPTTVGPASYGVPSLDQNRAYVAGYSGVVFAVSLETRSVVWRFPREGRIGAVVAGPVVARGRVVVGSSDGKVYIIDGATGELKDQWSTSGKVWATGAVADDMVYIGSFDKKVRAFSIMSGEKKWEFETDGAVAAAPVVDQGLVFVGSFDRNLYALGAADGKERWRFATGNWLWAKPVVVAGVAYIPSLDGKMYALRVENGQKLKEFEVDSPISSAPIVVGETVVFASERGGVYSIDTKTMGWRKLTAVSGVKAPLAAGDGTVYIHSEDRDLHAIDAQSGNKLWALRVE